MEIGIDKISFYVPNTYINLSDLASARGIDVNKYERGLMQYQMSVAPMNQDVVSMAANAAHHIIDENNNADIDLVLFATETGVDQSKAAATHIHRLLQLNPQARSVELKQACYATTAALYFAKGHILQNPKSKVLILASDIAKYGVKTDGEPTQGAGAVAIIVSAQPSILVLENQQGYYTEDIYDFWRPNHLQAALVKGHFSNEKYKDFFIKVYQQYLDKSNHTLSDIQAICFHIPYAKIGYRSLQIIADVNSRPDLFHNYRLATIYNQRVGNIYTGSLYLSLISLLEQGDLKAGSRVGLYSYGSGAVAEFFSGTLVKGYKEALLKEKHETLLDKRQLIDIKSYESLIENHMVEDIELAAPTQPIFYLKAIKEQQRLYEYASESEHA